MLKKSTPFWQGKKLSQHPVVLTCGVNDLSTTEHLASGERRITSHHVAGVDPIVDVTVPSSTEPFYQLSHLGYGELNTEIRFQHGSVCQHGPNGVTVESLLAVIKDRLEVFQAGSEPCDENSDALAHIDMALRILKGRTLRMQAEHASV